MPTLQHALVAIGPNDRDYVDTFFDVVEPITGPAGATVTLLHAFPREEYEDLTDQLDASGGLEPDVLAERHDDIQTPAAQFEDAGIETRVRGVIGNPETEVVRVAEEIDADLLFIGGAGRSPTEKAIFGDSAQRILLNSSCPVTYIQRE
jgi:nucleotide-binding universal stress UspA family protein